MKDMSYEAHAGGAGAGNLLSTRYFFFWALATSWELAFFHSSFIVLTETKFSFRCIPVGIGTLLQYVPDAGYFS